MVVFALGLTNDGWFYALPSWLGGLMMSVLVRLTRIPGVRNVRFHPLSCSPFQAAGANILLLAIERFKPTVVRQGKRHDHENDG